MAETTDKEAKNKTLSVSRPGRLDLKTTVDGGQVRQNFPRGRSKSVAVEVKKRRVIKPGRQGAEAETPEVQPEVKPAAKSQAKKAVPEKPAVVVDTTQDARAPIVLKNLTSEERASRARALGEALKSEEEARKRAEEDARKRAEDDRRIATERAEAERRAKEDEHRRAKDEESRLKAEVQAARLLEEEPAADGQTAAARTERGRVEEEAAESDRRGVKDRRSRLAPRSRNAPRRRSGKLTVSEALVAEDEEGRARSLAAARRAREKLRQQQMGLQQGGGTKKVVREVIVPEAITVQELSNRMAVRGGEVVKKLMDMGQMVTINQAIDADTAQLLVEEFGHKAKRVSAADVEVGLKRSEDPDEIKVPRPPVVTIMGHVDHGKTSLLDALRKTDVVSGEAGGITQHIGAYQVTLAGGDKITFLDTPGHAAFTAMRARGASVTDIVILVVAADDGVMPQTREAIDHAKAAGVPIIVAINKCDLPGADPNRVRQELLQHDMVVEQMGGDVLDVEVSAKNGTGLDKLEEAILLQAEVMELGANPDRSAEGVVVEAKLEKGRGAVTTALVQRGTLKVGDIMVVGKEWGRIRALVDDHGNNVKDAGPSFPVEVLGLSGTPDAGDEFQVVENERRAREVSSYREDQERDEKITALGRASLEQMFANIAAGEVRELPLVIKTDVQGSAEAISASLNQFATEEVAANVLLSAVGGITESDVTLAKASNAIIMGFGVRANSQARTLAEREGVELRYYNIIYELLDDVKGMLSGLLSPRSEEKVLGAAQVLETFDITKVGRIAGCRVLDGIVRRNARVRVLRDGVPLFDGAIKNLKHHKDEVREIKAGQECGILLDGFHDVEVGDEIEAYELQEVARTLD